MQNFNFTAARRNMLEGQIRPNKVSFEPLLQALETLPREEFLPPALHAVAYAETAVEVAPSRQLLPPMVLARMVESLALTPTSRVLDIAGMSGYSTAVLANCCAHATLLESDPGLISMATKALAACRISNAAVVHGPISLGAKQNAPYDAMLINGAVAEVPKTLFGQLVEGGRLVAIIGGEVGISPGQVTLFTKYHGSISQRPLFEAAASYVPGFTTPERFVFA